MLTASRSDWAAMLSVISEIGMNEVLITTDGEKATAMSIDPSKVMFVKCIMDCKGDAESFAVNSNTLLKAIQASGEGNPDIEIDIVRSTIKVIGQNRIRVPMLDREIAAVADVTARFTEYVGMGKIDPARLDQIVSYAMFRKQARCVMDNVGDTLTVCVGDTAEDTAECSCQGGHGEGHVVCALSYIAKLVKQSKGANDINVGFFAKDNAPIALEYMLGDSARITAILAPWIEEA